jgi:uncharacterized BrkB/YihY/UPF0761 family membrane protein
VSSATPVPETYELTGDDARETLQRVGTGRLLADAWMRLRVSDGFSHARSLAYTTALVLVQAIIGAIGLVSALGAADAHGTIVRTLRAAVPGPAGDMLITAVRQAHQAGASGQYLGLLFGIVGSLVTGATLMGQVERALNRLYGVETDRPTFEKYRLALLLAMSAGALASVAFVLPRSARTWATRSPATRSTRRGACCGGHSDCCSWSARSRCSSGARRAATSPHGRGSRSPRRCRCCCGAW